METLKYILNIEPSPIDKRDFVAEAIYNQDFILPDTFTTVPDLMPVRNQGSQGTCAAQVAACMKEWQELKDVKFNQYMSPQFVYNSRPNSPGEGMFPRDVMKILYDEGCCSEIVYPYGSMGDVTDTAKNEAKKYTISGYAAISTIDAMKRALVKNGPCFIAVPVFNFGARMWKPNQGDRIIGGHALTVAGYTTSGFIIRNSWGETWNGNGYTTFPYEDWGIQYEAWTTLDADSSTPPAIIPLPWYKRFIRYIKQAITKHFTMFNK